MNKSASSLRLRSAATALLASLTLAPQAFADFSFTDAGPYDYNTTGNWSGGTINNTWSTTLTANQSITFAADTTLSSGLTIGNSGLFSHTFTGSGANRTLTLGGNVSLGSSATNANKVTLGSVTDGQKLNVDLGGASRIFGISTNRTLELLNTLSGTGSITKQGAGTLQLAGTNSYTGSTSIGTTGQVSGILEVTKLANGGSDSSIGKSNNSSSNLVFGGTATGTLRYVGTGDSTDRNFLIGGVGAIFDASGTGALTWTNASAPAYASAGVARTITFKGSNSGNNTMSAAFADSGAGKISFLKEGTGTWVLAGANIYTGGTIVSAGTLATGTTGTFGTGNITVATGAFLTAGNASSFADTATLTFSRTSTAASISLSSGTDMIGAVYDSISATYMTAGTHDAAALNSFFGTSVFTGLGSLTISAIPEPSTFALLTGAVGLLLASFRRQRRAA